MTFESFVAQINLFVLGTAGSLICIGIAAHILQRWVPDTTWGWQVVHFVLLPGGWTLIACGALALLVFPALLT